MQHRIAHESLAPRKSGDCFTVITDVTRSMLYEHESLDDNGNEIIVYPQGTSGYIIEVKDGFCNFDNGKGVGCWMLKDWIKFTGKNKWDRAATSPERDSIVAALDSIGIKPLACIWNKLDREFMVTKDESLKAHLVKLATLLPEHRITSFHVSRNDVTWVRFDLVNQE